MRNEYETGMDIKAALTFGAAYAVSSGTAAGLAVRYLETLRSGQDVIPWVITAAVIYYLGTIADTTSTIETLETVNRADRVGVVHNVVETNPFLPNRPTVQDIIRGPGLATDIAGELVALALPPVGIGLGAGRMVGAIHNIGIKRSLEEKFAKLKRLRDAEREPIKSIEAARNILQGVVSEYDNSVTPQTPTEQVAGFPFRRIRESIAVVGTDLINRCPVEEDDESYALKKSFGRNKNDATLTFSKLGRRKIVYDDDRYWDVKLDVGSLHTEVPLQIAASVNAVSFTDDRTQYSRNRSTSDSSRQPLSVREHRRLLRGMRWVCANILEWEKPGIISPQAA